MQLREERHPARKVLRWLPEVVVLALVAAAFATQGLDVSDKLFGSPAKHDPASVAPPAGLDLAAGAPAPPVAATDTGGRIDPAAVRRALTGPAAQSNLGPHAAVWVSDLGSGSIVFRHGAGAVMPASTMKLLTTTAALQVLGPMARFHTSVRMAGANTVILVGGGDPFLMSTRAKTRGLYPARADLQTLAAHAARALAAKGVHRVRLSYDATLFTGPRVNPAWPPTYVPEDVVPPITALWADEGRGSNGRYVADPAASAAALFAKALTANRIAVTGPIRPAKAPAGSAWIADVASAPLGQIVEKTLAVSDNNAAEVIGHQVGFAVAHDASFRGGAAAVTEVLNKLGVPMAGSQIHDGSGLSREDRLTPPALLAVLGLASSPAHPKLRQAITGLPVAGFTGSLQWRFEKGPADAKGRVRAKTGTLTGVSGLAGIAVDAEGNRMAFVAIADRVTSSGLARGDLDQIAAALGACDCGVRTGSP